MSTTCINNYKIPIFFKGGHTLHCYLSWINFAIAAKERYLSFGGVLLQLVECTGPESIRANQSGLVAFLFKEVCIFCARSGFTRTLQPYKHDYIALSFLDLRRLLFAIQHQAQLVKHSFLNNFALIQSSRHLTYVDLVFNVLPKLLYHGYVNVGLQQSSGNILKKFVQHCLVYNRGV